MTQSLFVVALLGLGSSVLTEAISWLNAKLNGTGLTALKGKASLLVVITISFAVAIIQTAVAGSFTLSNIGKDWAEIFATSQVVFAFIIDQFGFTVPTIPTNGPVNQNA